jgi:hypothetical protein
VLSSTMAMPWPPPMRAPRPGRCLVALGTPEADSPLREARQLFTTMGYAPALSETDALLRRAMTPASSRQLATIRARTHARLSALTCVLHGCGGIAN